MKSFTALWRVALAVGVAAGCLLVSAGGAYAAGGVSLCIPEAENAATVTPTKDACPAKYKLTELGAEGKEGKEGKAGKEGKEGTFAGLTTAEKETLLAVLPYVKFVKEGIDKKPTIQFSGANMQVVSGAAKESEIDGLGNLVVGRDEAPGTQTGSNNLVVGTFKQSFTSYGGLLAGAYNTVSAGSASVSGGEYSTASGLRASVSGGYDNAASNEGASVSGGQVNKASGTRGLGERRHCQQSGRHRQLGGRRRRKRSHRRFHRGERRPPQQGQRFWGLGERWIRERFGRRMVLCARWQEKHRDRKLLVDPRRQKPLAISRIRRGLLDI